MRRSSSTEKQDAARWAAGKVRKSKVCYLFTDDPGENWFLASPLDIVIVPVTTYLTVVGTVPVSEIALKKLAEVPWEVLSAALPQPKGDRKRRCSG